MGFTYKNIHSDTYGVVETVSCPILPQAKTLTYNPQWRDGEIDYSAMTGRIFYEDRIFEFKLKIKANSLQVLYTKAHNVATWLQGNGELILDSRPNVVFDAQVVQTVDFTPMVLGQYAELTISFRVKSLAREKNSSTHTCSLIANQEQSITTINSGDVSVDTEITLDGGEYGTLSITGTGINFVYTDILNEVTIRSDTQEVIRAGHDVTNRSNMKFILLKHGPTILKITSTTNCTMVLKYTDLYF